MIKATTPNANDVYIKAGNISIKAKRVVRVEPQSVGKFYIKSGAGSSIMIGVVPSGAVVPVEYVQLSSAQCEDMRDVFAALADTLRT
jgi:hypothetical protein